MRTRSFLVVAGVAALLTLLSTSGRGDGPMLQRAITIDRFQQLTTDYTTGRPLITSGKPKWCIKWDDGRAAQATANQVKQFLNRGIDVTMALIPDETDAGTGMTWAQVRELLAHAAARGVDLEIAHHSKTTFASGTPWSMSYDEIVAELDRTLCADSSGYDPKVFVLPGDGKIPTFWQKNRAVMSSLLDSLGYDYGMCAALDDSSGYHLWLTSSLSPDLEPTIGGSTKRFFRPGIVKDPYWMPVGINLDLGNYVVERDGSETSGTTDWTLPVEGATKGGSGTADWEETFQYLYSIALAGNYWMCITMHDSVATDGLHPSPLTADSLSVGHFSPTHVAWACSALAAQGLVEFVTASEWCDGLLGRYAPGTDLVSNPSCIIPQFAIGDTSGTEYPYPQGFGTVNYAGASFPAANAFPLTSFVQGTNGKFIRSGDTGYNTTFPTDVLGPSIKGFMGRDGGINFVTGQVNALNFTFAGLTPGRYRMSFALNNAAAWVLKEFHTRAGAVAVNDSASWANGGAIARSDTTFGLVWRDQDMTFATTPGVGNWTTRYMEFNFPVSPNISGAVLGNQQAEAGPGYLDLTGTTSLLEGSATYNPASMLTLTQVTTTVTVTGAVLGDLVTLSHSTDLLGVTLTGHVSSANTVTAVYTNSTAGTVDVAEGTLRAKVTHTIPQVGPDGFVKRRLDDWLYMVGLMIQPAGNRMSHLQLVYLGPY